MENRKSSSAAESKYAHLRKPARQSYLSSDQSTRLFWRGVGYILAGLFCGALAVYEYHDLTDLETNGGVRLMRIWVKAIYSIGGKWGVVGVLSLISVCALLLGIRMLAFLMKHK